MFDKRKREHIYDLYYVVQNKLVVTTPLGALIHTKQRVNYKYWRENTTTKSLCVMFEKPSA